jgi:hypothetical protein
MQEGHDVFSESLVARDELGRVGGLRHFRVLRNGGPPGPERSRGEQGGGACPPVPLQSGVRNALK